MTTLVIVQAALALAIATAANAEIPFPDPPATQSINCEADGPKACERLALLRHLFGDGASQVPSACHFSLVITPENTMPRYRARKLALVCHTGGAYGNGASILYWRDGHAVITTND